MNCKEQPKVINSFYGKIAEDENINLSETIDSLLEKRFPRLFNDTNKAKIVGAYKKGSLMATNEHKNIAVYTGSGDDLCLVDNTENTLNCEIYTNIVGAEKMNKLGYCDLSRSVVDFRLNCHPNIGMVKIISKDLVYKAIRTMLFYAKVLSDTETMDDLDLWDLFRKQAIVLKNTYIHKTYTNLTHQWNIVDI